MQIQTLREWEEKFPYPEDTLFALADDARAIEKERDSWKQTASMEAEGLESWKKVAEKAEAELSTVVEINNPCGHTGVESFVCEKCGYPDPRKIIAKLKAELAEARAALGIYEEAILHVLHVGSMIDGTRAYMICKEARNKAALAGKETK